LLEVILIGRTGAEGRSDVNFREGIMKCSDEVYSKVTGIRQHNRHLFGVHRLHVSTC